MHWRDKFGSSRVLWSWSNADCDYVNLHKVLLPYIHSYLYIGLGKDLQVDWQITLCTQLLKGWCLTVTHHLLARRAERRGEKGVQTKCYSCLMSQLICHSLPTNVRYSTRFLTSSRVTTILWLFSSRVTTAHSQSGCIFPELHVNQETSRKSRASEVLPNLIFIFSIWFFYSEKLLHLITDDKEYSRSNARSMASVLAVLSSRFV